ncbi:GNAT family N-acetyltransferase [Lysobacter auxotrophicus]|uniref:GNAT family N-acetyltransferase n=1 Tax=Lysobacter auxotrophicus TaxID=2992573 RepID=A0ABM8DI96_9GAMM|nr:GNAT family N-acetyltransferase [Lysobacter auxotrophicus]BDU18380.1 GNAT family N-acetyltransferase [Lysobacter auxotrophicus]
MSAVTARVRVEPIVDPDSIVARRVRELRVAPDQYRYVGDTTFNLGDTLRDPMSEAMAVIADDAVVGFYRLDFAPNAVVGRSLGMPSVGLRAFAIDHRQQGRGFGQAAMRACCDDLRERHPEREVLVLTVNCINAPAISAYLKSGFKDTGELFHGGSAGPQHVMLQFLHPHPESRP